jgi:hypothetical protein
MKKDVPGKVAEVAWQGKRVVQHHPAVKDPLQGTETDNRPILSRSFSGPEEAQTPRKEQDREHPFVRDVERFPTAGGGNPIEARRRKRKTQPVDAHCSGQEPLQWTHERRLHHADGIGSTSNTDLGQGVTLPDLIGRDMVERSILGQQRVW